MKKLKRKNCLLIVLLITTLILIPDFLTIIERYIEIPVENDKPNTISNTISPQKSENSHIDTNGYVSGGYECGHRCPIITDSPSDFTVEIGYTGKSLSWTATDLNPNTYTIALQGEGQVVAPTPWTSSVPIVYNIPNGFGVGAYVYTVNFTDECGHFATDSVTFTVEETTSPIITDSPNDFTVEMGYTGKSLSWTATDLNPNTYTIALQGEGQVVAPTPWTSDVSITYNIPDGFAVGAYVYTVNFTDDDGHFATDSVTFTVEDTTSPIITDSPSDFTVEMGYTGKSLSWTAMDLNPNTYTIALQGEGQVVAPTPWTSDIPITYNIPDGFAVGAYVYTVNFTDDYGHFATDSVIFTVEDTTSPIITDSPNDFTVEMGYTGKSLSWTATDLNPNTYTIALQGEGQVVAPTPWTSDVSITYNVPDGFGIGIYVYNVNFTDDYDNFVIDTISMTVKEAVDNGNDDGNDDDDDDDDDDDNADTAPNTNFLMIPILLIASIVTGGAGVLGVRYYLKKRGKGPLKRKKEIKGEKVQKKDAKGEKVQKKDAKGEKVQKKDVKGEKVQSKGKNHKET